MKIISWMDRVDNRLKDLYRVNEELKKEYAVHYDEKLKILLFNLDQIVHDIEIARSYGPKGCRYKR